MVLEGQPAKFEAVIDGIPFPDSIWLKEGQSLMKNDSINFERKEGAVTCQFPNTNRTALFDGGLEIVQILPAGFAPRDLLMNNSNL